MKWENDWLQDNNVSYGADSPIKHQAEEQ